jgi:probable F420-dependent oxidoreductase
MLLPMKIGLQPPTSGPLARPELMAELAETADRLHFHSLYVTDHVVIPAEVQSRYPYNASGVLAARPDDPYFEPITLMSFLAARTTHLRLGTSVLVLPYRNPVLVAKQLACVDALSNGRLILGIGTGWMEEEFRILGAPSFAERGAITDEYIEVFRKMWRENRPSFEGKYVSFPALGVNPKPAQPAGIPILVGGHARPAIRRAARLGDGWMPLKLSTDELSDALAYLREHAEKAGRDPASLLISLRLGLRLTTSATERRDGEENMETALVGAPRDVMATIEKYRDLGVTEMAFDFRTCQNEDELRETVTLCGEFLVPAFAGPD